MKIIINKTNGFIGGFQGSWPRSNMVLFDAEGKIAKYNSALDILKEFCRLRRGRYRDVHHLKGGYLVSFDQWRSFQELSNLNWLEHDWTCSFDLGSNVGFLKTCLKEQKSYVASGVLSLKRPGPGSPQVTWECERGARCIRRGRITSWPNWRTLAPNTADGLPNWSAEMFRMHLCRRTLFLCLIFLPFAGSTADSNRCKETAI